MNKFNALFLLALLSLFSCGKSHESFPLELKAKSFVVSQPTPGSNTAQLELPFEEIKAAAEAKGFDASQISAVKLEKAELTAQDNQNLNGFESVLMQMMTPKAKLTEVAVLNPIPAGSTKVSLGIAEKAEMTEYFKGENINIVLDLNAADGDTLEHKMVLDATFSISAAKK